MAFHGFDIDQYPGEAAIRDAVAQGFSWVGSYLIAPSHHDGGWPDYPTLKATGINPVPIWVGGQVVGPGSHDVGAAQGAVEGDACVTELVAKGYPAGYGVVFDTENGPPIPDNQAQHLTAWRDRVRAGGYRALDYGSHLNFAILEGIFGADNVWSVDLRNPDPATFLGVAVQCQQEIPLTLAGRTYSVDRSVSLVADPCAAGDQPVQVVFPPMPTVAPTPVVEPAPEPIPAPTVPPQPPVPLTPSVPQLAPAFVPAPVAPQPLTVATVAAQATPARVGASVALTGVLAGVTAMSGAHVADLRGLIDLAFIYLIAPIALGVVAGLAMSIANLLHINMQSALSQRVLIAAENGASVLVSKAQTAADEHATFTTKNEMIAGATNYVNTAVPDAVKALGLATPAGQSLLANLVEGKIQQAVTAALPPTPVPPGASA